MTKREIIDHIRRLNPTAAADFLARFSEEDLLAYLHQLRDVEDRTHTRTPAEPALAG